ncbi:MAG: hypothetical protein EBS53_00475 [Bacteroidetes bacterium]|nr:hypothetical protein [Bacteroidota bacterium]
MQCAICEKQIYGHKAPTKGKPVVCGSCTLTKVDSAVTKTGKSLYQIRADIAKITADPTRHEDYTMSFVAVRSNYAREKTILLGGKHPLSFDSRGVALCPAHLCELLEHEMSARPGRYWYEESSESSPISTSVLVEKAVAVPAVVVAPEEESVSEEVTPPVEISVSFDDEPKKASSKTKQKK